MGVGWYIINIQYLTPDPWLLTLIEEYKQSHFFEDWIMTLSTYNLVWLISSDWYLALNDSSQRGCTWVGFNRGPSAIFKETWCGELDIPTGIGPPVQEYLFSLKKKHATVARLMFTVVCAEIYKQIL